MPIYQYRCPVCDFSEEVIKSMSVIDRPEYCSKCHTLAERIIQPSGGYPFTPYYSDNLSPYNDRPILVESVSHRKQLEREANVIPWHPRRGDKGCWV